MSYTIIGTERVHTIISYYRGGVTVAKNSVHNQLSVSQGRVMDHVLAPAQCTPSQDSRLRITSRGIGIPLVFPKKLKISLYIQYFPKRPSCFPKKTKKTKLSRTMASIMQPVHSTRKLWFFWFFWENPLVLLGNFDHIHRSLNFLGKHICFVTVVQLRG